MAKPSMSILLLSIWIAFSIRETGATRVDMKCRYKWGEGSIIQQQYSDGWFNSTRVHLTYFCRRGAEGKGIKFGSHEPQEYIVYSMIQHDYDDLVRRCKGARSDAGNETYLLAVAYGKKFNVQVRQTKAVPCWLYEGTNGETSAKIYCRSLPTVPSAWCWLPSPLREYTVEIYGYIENEYFKVPENTYQFALQRCINDYDYLDVRVYARNKAYAMWSLDSNAEARPNDHNAAVGHDLRRLKSMRFLKPGSAAVGQQQGAMARGTTRRSVNPFVGQRRGKRTVQAEKDKWCVLGKRTH